MKPNLQVLLKAVVIIIVQVPVVLPPVVAADTPLSEVMETAPPAPATLGELEKKLAELKVNLQLS